MAPGAVFRGWLDALFSRDRRENAKVYIKPLDLSGSLGLVFRMDKRTLPPILRSQTVPPSQPSTRLWSTPGLFAVLLGSSILTTACVSGGGPPSSMVVAPESVWQSLRRPRPQPLATAPRISVGEVILVGGAWPEESAVSHTIGLQELVAAGLIRRRDVQFVERRRFSAAVEREARGLPPLRNSPAPGVSPGAQLQLAGSWIPSGGSAILDLRLIDVETSAIVAAWRTTTPQAVDPTAVARTIVGSTISALQELGRVPAWTDPLASASIAPSPTEYTPSGISTQAVAAFLRGVAAEDRFDWETARRAYQQAIESAGAGFFEPDLALARVARLRAGGTLGASDD